MHIMRRPEPPNFMGRHVLIPIDKVLQQQAGQSRPKAKSPIKNSELPKPHHYSKANRAHQNIRQELSCAHRNRGNGIFALILTAYPFARDQKPLNTKQDQKGGRGDR